MATKKSNSSNKSKKDKSTKSKSAAKTVEKTEIEATKTSTVDKSSTPEKTNTAEKTATTEKTTKKKSCLSGFFAKKYDENESVLTVFKNHKFYGALLGEVIGTMLLTLLFFASSFMGMASVATYAFALIAILIAVYAFSGACLNPVVAAGMMASRRMSVIRGVMYIIAEVIGAWIGWLIFNSFHLAGGDTAYPVPAITAIGENQFWLYAMVELLGAAIIAFCFARALKYKRSVFTFAVVTTGGIVLAFLISYIFSAAFLGLESNFIMNPAVAMMMQIFPTSGEFGEIIGGICQALSAFAIIPMIGGVIGFYLSDFNSKLVGEE